MFMVYGPCPPKVVMHLDKPALMIRGLSIYPSHIYIIFVFGVIKNALMHVMFQHCLKLHVSTVKLTARHGSVF